MKKYQKIIFLSRFLNPLVKKKQKKFKKKKEIANK
jgi:hypothetical protein